MQGRAAARENESDTPVVPITVRQLEAVRIAESYARMQLQVKPTPAPPCACANQQLLNTSMCPLAGACPTSAGTLPGIATVKAKVSLAGARSEAHGKPCAAHGD